MDLVDACFANGQLDRAKLKLILTSEAALPITRANMRKLETGSLVTFRGMVQDMFDPELFRLEYNEGKNTGMYRDSVPMSWKEDELRYGEREVVYLVPVPGEAMWVKHLLDSPQNTNNNQTTTDKADKMDLEAEEMKSTAAFKRTKMAHEDSNKTLVVNDDENLPYPDAELLPCFIKIYEKELEQRKCKLHDVVTVIGVLSLEYFPCDNAEEYETRDCLPAQIAPRIHVIDLKFHDSLLPTEPNNNDGVALARALCSKLLGDALQSDALAAEFALLWAVSSAENEVVGRLTLGLAKTNTQTASALCALLPNLLTRVETSTVQDLNLFPLAPYKDVARNRLVAGRLQVAPGTRIVLDETRICVGQQLNELALRNIQSLDLLCKTQQIEYDFHGFQRFQAVDAPVLVLFETSKPLTVPDALDVIIPLRVGGGSSSNTMLPSSNLHACQEYIERARERVKQVEIPEQIAKQVENDFVASRQDKDSKITDRDLHLWLNLAKLTCASLGRTRVTMEDYSRAKTLDDERRKRI